MKRTLKPATDQEAKELLDTLPEVDFDQEDLVVAIMIPKRKGKKRVGTRKPEED
jgi:hypothetical protein